MSAADAWFSDDAAIAEVLQQAGAQAGGIAEPLITVIGLHRGRPHDPAVPSMPLNLLRRMSHAKMLTERRLQQVPSTPCESSCDLRSVCLHVQQMPCIWSGYVFRAGRAAAAGACG